MSKRCLISPFIKQCFVTAAVDLSILGYGSAFGFPAILLPQLTAHSSIPLTKSDQSWIASVFALGMICGYFLTPPVMDRLGRKRAHYVVTVLAIVGWFTTILATDVQALIVGRVFHGISGGLLSTLSTILLGECTSPSNRGAFLTTITLSQSAGILLVHFLGSLLNWRRTALVCVFFPFVSLIMAIYTPESPSWLLSQGRYEKCQRVFRWFRGHVEEEELTAMLSANSKKEKAEANKDPSNNSWLKNTAEVIVQKEFYKPITIMIHSNNLLQFAGGTIIVTYPAVIIALTMGPTASVYLWTLFLDIIRIISNIIAVFVVHRFKRRTLILYSGVLCIISHLVLAAYLYATTVGQFDPSIWVPAVFVSLLQFSNAVGIVPIRNVIAGELFPLRYRSIGGSISLASGSCFMFLVLKTFPALLGSLNLYGTYILYGAVLAYSLLVLWIMLPETKGRTLQEIEDEFTGNEQNKVRHEPIEGCQVK